MGLPADREHVGVGDLQHQRMFLGHHKINILREYHIVELRLRHTNSSIMAQGCDLEVPLIGERPSALPPRGAVPGVVPGDSWRPGRRLGLADPVGGHGP
jgi:hypothetical protein